ncbi:hypothetical protein BC834DRAFT_845186 [Gloeopeniophorella convolvens]|nr:hypothetical protein BC834DRAFT_845186 [Gloeopeniophorella convolvens]
MPNETPLYTGSDARRHGLARAGSLFTFTSTPTIAPSRGQFTATNNQQPSPDNIFGEMYSESPLHPLPVQNSTVQPWVGTISAQVVDDVSNDMMLDDTRRGMFHRYSKATAENQSAMVIAWMLRSFQDTDALAINVREITEMLHAVNINTRLSWRLLAEQQMVLKRLKHVFKSNLRKLIFKSVTKKQSLKAFTNKIVNKYQDQLPDVFTLKGIKAQMALARSIARPLVKKKARKGADTGFWKDMNKMLLKLKLKYKGDRTRGGWETWYDQIIKEDEDHFGTQEALVSDESGTDEEETGAGTSGMSSLVEPSDNMNSTVEEGSDEE